MKHSKITALLCALAIAGTGVSSVFAEEAKTPTEAELAATVMGTEAPKTETAPEVNYTDALLKGLSLTLPDVQKSVDEGTFKNLSPEAPKPIPEPEPIPEPIPEPEPEPEPAPKPKYMADQGETANELNTDGTYDGMTYISEKDNENALRVTMAYIDANGDTITKTGNVDDVENSDLYGKNAALLVSHGGHGAFTNAKISTTGIGSVGAYGYSKGTYINLTDSTIDTTGNNSPAVELTERAMMKLSNTNVTTSGYASPAIKVGNKGGIFLAENSHFTTAGQNSHGVYTTGDVTITNGTINARQTKAAVIKNNNTLSLEGSTLEGNETGSVFYNIVLCADENAIGTMGTQQFNATDSTLISHKGGMFYVTGTHGRITLTNTTIQQDPNLPIFTVIGNDGTYGWSEAGSNGGHLQLILQKQNLEGNILVDSISDVNMNLTEGSTWTGAIHIVPNADGGAAYSTNADLFISEGSTWNLTEDSEATSINNLGTINYNGHKITLADGTVMQG
jgi:hypothetical protein